MREIEVGPPGAHPHQVDDDLFMWDQNRTPLYDPSCAEVLDHISSDPILPRVPQAAPLAKDLLSRAIHLFTNDVVDLHNTADPMGDSRRCRRELSNKSSPNEQSMADNLRVLRSSLSVGACRRVIRMMIGS